MFAWAISLRSGTQGHLNEESGPRKPTPLFIREAVEVSNEFFIQTSNPVPSTSMDQQASPQSFHDNPLVQPTPISTREAVENPLVRAGLVPQHLADIFVHHVQNSHCFFSLL